MEKEYGGKVTGSSLLNNLQQKDSGENFKMLLECHIFY